GRGRRRLTVHSGGVTQWCRVVALHNGVAQWRRTWWWPVVLHITMQVHDSERGVARGSIQGRRDSDSRSGGACIGLG
ncbi:hypothetical protein U1Q18_010907, partial [Sarracenia purpurea var. burkii]